MNVPVNNNTLPSGFCPASYQEMLNGFSAQQYVNIDSSGNRIIVSGSPPTDTSVLWLRLNSVPSGPLRIYYFDQGAWLSLHPLSPGMSMPWFGTLPDFTTFDDGDNGSPGYYSGPMWELVTEMAAKFPLAAGTLPSGTAVNTGDTGGEEKVSIKLENMYPHQHTVLMVDSSLNRVPAAQEGFSSGRGIDTTDATGNPPLITDVVGGNSDKSDSVAHNNIPPYLGMNWIRRTQRLYYTVT